MAGGEALPFADGYLIKRAHVRRVGEGESGRTAAPFKVVGIGQRLTLYPKPTGRALVNGFGIGIRDLVEQATRISLLHLELEGVITCGANAAIIEGWCYVWIWPATGALARARGQIRIVVPTDVSPVGTRPHVGHVNSGRSIHLPLNAKVPLL